jgi:hypothetical protein
MNSVVKFFSSLVLLSSLSLFAQEKAKLGEGEIRDSERIRFTNRSNARAAENVKDKMIQSGKSFPS